MKRKIYKLSSRAKHGLFALALTLFLGTAYAQQTYSFSYSGAVQTMNLSGGTHIIQMWGADGGNNLTANTGGKGGYSTGTLNVTAPGTYYIYVGGKGITGIGGQGPAAGGFNGGGDAGAYTSASYAMGSGGGASHIASAPGLLSTLSANQTAVKIVAGGGGGSGSNNGATTLLNLGGKAGGLTGSNGLSGTYGGFGGTQTAGGNNSSVPLYSGTMAEGGSFGKGGSAHLAPPGYAAYPNNTGGGGGGGWYGGAAALWEGGGGGSSYVGGVSNGTTIAFGLPGYVTNPDVTGHGYVILTRLCDVNVTASKNPICEGESIVLSTNAGSSIQWNTGASTPSITVSPTVSTGYTVSGVSTSTSACSSTVSIMVNVNPLPVLALESFPPVFCAGEAGTVFATGALTYTWSNATTGSLTLVSPTVSSVYTATGTSIQGCKNTETVMVTVNTNSLTVITNTSICKGTSLNLMAGGVTSALWSNGAAFLNILVAPTSNTVYTVTGQDALGCTLSNTVTVNVLDLPPVTITADKQTVCRGESVTLTASGALAYLWDSAESTPIVTKTIPVNVPYQFSVTGTDANGCSASYQITVTGSACSGLNENEKVPFTIFPNPVINEITVSGAPATKKIISISDIHGKALILTESSDERLNVNVENLPAGVYNIQVTEGDATTVQKFIKL